MTAYRLLTTLPAAHAWVLLGALQAEGVRARLERDGLGTIYGLTSGPFATRVLVAADDHEQAKRLLEDVEAGP